MEFLIKLITKITSKWKTPNGEMLSVRIQILGLKRTVHFWFAQRILRINSHVKWPVHPSSVFQSPNKITRKSFLPYFASPHLYVQATNGIIVGNNLRVGPGVRIISADHDLLDYDKHISVDAIQMGDDCWLGANVIILPGVKLGNHVVVAAGAVVPKSFNEDNILIGGVPAKIIKTLGNYTGDNDRWTHV